MSPTATPPAPDPLRPDTRAFLEQQAAILLDAPDNDTMVRRLLAAARRRISELEQQLAAAAPPGRPRPQPSLRHPILTLLREQPDGLTRPQIEAAMARRGLGDTLQRMVRDALLVRTGDRYRLAHAAQAGQAQAEAAPPAGTGGPGVFSHPGPPQARRRPTPQGAGMIASAGGRRPWTGAPASALWPRRPPRPTPRVRVRDQVVAWRVSAPGSEPFLSRKGWWCRSGLEHRGCTKIPAHAAYGMNTNGCRAPIGINSLSCPLTSL